MTDLDQNSSTQSPRRKFSFRFPNLSHSTNHDGLSQTGNMNGNNAHQQNINYKERRNFSEEAKNVPDLQVSIAFNDIKHLSSLFVYHMVY
jgi:hypothetical protein